MSLGALGRWKGTRGPLAANPTSERQFAEHLPTPHLCPQFLLRAGGVAFLLTVAKGPYH